MAAQGAESRARTLLNGVVAVTWYTAKEAARAHAGAQSEYKCRAVWGLSDDGSVHFVQPCAVARCRRQAKSVNMGLTMVGFVSLESDKWIFADPSGQLGGRGAVTRCSFFQCYAGEGARGRCPICGAGSVADEEDTVADSPLR